VSGIAVLLYSLAWRALRRLARLPRI